MLVVGGRNGGEGQEGADATSHENGDLLNIYFIYQMLYIKLTRATTRGTQDDGMQRGTDVIHTHTQPHNS